MISKIDPGNPLLDVLVYQLDDFRGGTLGNAGSERSRKNAWVSFRAAEMSFFSLYSDSIKEFKTHYACVVALNALANKWIAKCEQRNLVSSKLDFEDQETLRIFGGDSVLSSQETY